jgi:hypothetical protein
MKASGTFWNDSKLLNVCPKAMGRDWKKMNRSVHIALANPARQVHLMNRTERFSSRKTPMRTLALTLALSLVALPALAGGINMDLPNLTWPSTGTLTISTSNCSLIIDAPAPQTATCS